MLIITNWYSRVRFLSFFPFTLLGQPEIAYHIHPENELIHRGIGNDIILDLSKCAMFSNPKNDNILLTLKPRKFQRNSHYGIHKAYPGPKSIDVCSCATASDFSHWISSMNETSLWVRFDDIVHLQSIQPLNDSTLLLHLLVCHFWDVLNRGDTSVYGWECCLSAVVLVKLWATGRLQLKVRV